MRAFDRNVVRIDVPRLLSIGLIVLAPAVCGAETDAYLVPHAAEYDVRIGLLRGTMSSQLDFIDGSYQSISIVNATGIARLIARGSIIEESTFKIVDGQLRPYRYTGSDHISSAGQDVSMSFDWTNSVIELRIDDQDIELELVPGAIDRASLQYALMNDLASGRVRDRYTIQDADETKVLNVRAAGKKTVKTPFAELTVVGVSHQAAGSSRLTTLWCAPALGYLPVVIEQYRDGKLKGQVLLSAYSPSRE